jgi:hypothetical protein
MQGSFYSLDLDWPKTMNKVFTTSHMNIFRYVSATYKCSSSGSTIKAYFAGILSAFVAPYCFILILIAAVSVFWLRFQYIMNSNREKRREDDKIKEGAGMSTLF